MARRIRTDIHRPSIIEPDNYDYVTTLYPVPISFYGLINFNNPGLELSRHIQKTGGKMSGVGRGGCDICGAAHKYSDVFYHEKSNEYIRVGEICGSKIFGNNAERFRAAKERSKFVAGKKKCLFLLEEAGLYEAIEINLTVESDWHNIYKFEVGKIKDVVATIEKKGKLSEKQANFLQNLIGKLYSKSAFEYDKAAKAIPKLSDGRQTLTGRVVHTKHVDNGFGGTVKMLFLTNDGQKIWATLPSSMGDDDTEVTIKVTTSKSDKDENFYFGSRPSVVK